MRKVSATICVITVLLLLSGCMSRKYKLAQSEENITRIEIVFCFPSETYHREELLKMEPMVVLEEAEWETILHDITSTPCHFVIGDPPFNISEHVIRIIYADGSVELIGAHGAVYYSERESRYRNLFYDRDEYYDFIWDYITNEG